MSLYKEIIGFTAGLLTTTAFLPQGIKIYKTNKTEDLSEKTFFILLFGIIMWIIYGFLIKSKSLLITNIVQIIIVMYILYKIKINKKSTFLKKF